MSQNNRPTVSAIIPVYNDPEGIDATLESLTDQTYAAYEILVVDNNSDDETRSVAESYASSHPDLVSVLVEDEIQSSYAARNRGVRNATGDILAFVDADMTVDRDWLESAVRSMRKQNARYMGCNVEIYIPKGEETIFAKYNKYTGFNVQRYIKEKRFAPTCCLFVEKSVFDEVGYFDSELVSGGDSEFGKRVFAAGIEPKFTPDVTMYHPARTTRRSLTNKYERIGWGIQQKSQLGISKKRRLIHPFNYLPPNPVTLRNRLQVEQMNIISFVLLYFVAYLDKLYRYKGRAAFYYSNRNL